LLSQGRLDEAWIVTERLHASKSDPTDSYEQAEYRQMSAQIKLERNHNAVGMFGQAKLTFNQKSFLKRLGLSFLVQFGNQCTGALVINNYNAQLFSGLGITGNTPLLLLGFNLVTVLGNLFNGLFIDRFGCRRFVLTSCCGILVCLSCEAALAARFVETGSANRAGLGFGVFLILAYVAFYSSYLDATMYPVPLEIFPMVTRSSGMSFSIMGQFTGLSFCLRRRRRRFRISGIGFRLF
jgi:MFS family permease